MAPVRSVVAGWPGPEPVLKSVRELSRVGRRPTFCLRSMYRQNQSLVDLLAPAIAALGYELWGLEHLARGRRSLLRIYIDSPEGISLRDCELVSRQVTGVLDVEDPIRGAYDLEVSSPGLDRPLFTVDQFRRFVGQPVRIRLNAKLEGRRQISGRLQDATDTAVTIVDAERSFIVPVDIIERARLIPEP